jgi:hypothetical protein
MDTVHFLSLPPWHNVSEAGHPLVFTRMEKWEEHIMVGQFETDSLQPWALFILR